MQMRRAIWFGKRAYALLFPINYSTFEYFGSNSFREQFEEKKEEWHAIWIYWHECVCLAYKCIDTIISRLLFSKSFDLYITAAADNCLALSAISVFLGFFF